MKTLISIGECMLELSAMRDELWRMGVAGDTLNTAWYARACLSKKWRVSFATKIGSDVMSSRVISFLRQNNIATDRIHHHPTRTVGLYAIQLNKGERSFSYWRDTSAARLIADEKKVLQQMLEGADIIHFSGITLAILPPVGREKLLFILQRLRKKGVFISFDPNIRPKLWDSLDLANSIISKAACLCDVVFPSFEEESEYFGDSTPVDTINRYSKIGVQVIVVKNAGSSIFGKERDNPVACIKIQKKPLLDSTGAGDSFNGVFLAAYNSRFNFENSIRKAHNVSAYVIRHKGALVPMQKIKEIYKS